MKNLLLIALSNFYSYCQCFRSHLWHLQQAQTGILRGPAGPGHDWRCQHPVEGGPRVAEEARHVNTMSTFLNITKATIKIFPGFFPVTMLCGFSWILFIRGFLPNNFDGIFSLAIILSGPTYGRAQSAPCRVGGQPMVQLP